MNTALNNDFKFLKELNYTSAYVLPALTLLSAQLQQINTHIESLQSQYLNGMKFTEGTGGALFFTVMDDASTGATSHLSIIFADFENVFGYHK
uniref:Uncharacterized protein n=1 Tax=Parascaris equorum TaxID=6256 RepID=A0A914RXW3_PAREQ